MTSDTPRHKGSDIDELIARLEKATGPDRELDIAILYAVDIGRWKYCENKTAELIAECRSKGLTGRDDACRRSAFFDTPKYTASLDAAMQLVPEGWFWFLGHLDQTDRRFVATVQERAVVGDPSFNGFSLAPAIALTIAALKAWKASHDL